MQLVREQCMVCACDIAFVETRLQPTDSPPYPTLDPTRRRLSLAAPDNTTTRPAQDNGRHGASERAATDAQ
jgi:hypothetical protein